METPASLIESLFEKAEAYGKTTFELSKLKALDTATNVATAFIARLSVIIMIFLFALIMSIGVALFLGELFGKPSLGFFIVAAFYLVTIVILYLYLHVWIKKPVGDLIMTHTLQ
jgi:hypothetical protein